MQPTSLHGFCKTHNLPKSTAHQRLREAGFDTSNGLDENAIAFLYREFKLKTQPSSPEPAYPLRAGGLVPRGERRRLARQTFDAEAYQADKSALEADAHHTAVHLNGAVMAYAKARFASVLADIDLAADSMRANALGAMGFEMGKPEAASGNGSE